MRTGGDGTLRSSGVVDRTLSSDARYSWQDAGSQTRRRGFTPADPTDVRARANGSCKVASDPEGLDESSFSVGRAAAMLGVRVEFLRRLDQAQAVIPSRSPGGHRRYSRRQLQLLSRLRELLDQSFSLTASLRIIALEDELATAQSRIEELRGIPRQLTFRALTELPEGC